MKNFLARVFLALLCLGAGSALADPGTADNKIGSAANVSPVDCSGTVVTGGTAVNAIAASPGVHGFIIANLDVTEALWVSFTGAATVNTIGSFPISSGTVTTLAGAGSFSSIVGAGFNTNLSVNATTSGHKFSCVRW